MVEPAHSADGASKPPFKQTEVEFEEIMEELSGDPGTSPLSEVSGPPAIEESHTSATDIPSKTLKSINDSLGPLGVKARAASSLHLGGHMRLATFRNIVEAIDAYPFSPEDPSDTIRRGLHCFKGDTIGNFLYPIMDIRDVNHPKKKFIIAAKIDFNDKLGRDLSNVTVALSDLMQALPWAAESLYLIVLPPDQFTQAKAMAFDANARSRYLQTVDPAKNPQILAIDLIQLLIDMPGSDLHLDFSADGRLVPQIRKDGILQPLRLTGGKTVQLERDRGNSLITIFMNLGGLDIADKGAMQDGKVHFSDSDFMSKHGHLFAQRDEHFRKVLPGYSLRVAYTPTVTGSGLTVRLLHSTKEGRESLDDSRLGIHVKEALRETINLTTGLIAVSGPTGSGKSTTLYRALSEGNTGERKIATIEDPVERIVSLGRQIEIGMVRTGNTKRRAGFADALRAIVRMDPDIILVGETRDYETAEAAIHSALTGHLVWTTVHANDALKAFERFFEFRDGQAEIDRGSFLNAIQLSYAQRLVRQFCTDCSHPEDLSNTYNDFFGLKGEDRVSELILPVATGEIGGSECPSCFGTGYVSRLPLGEYLKVDEAFTDLVREGVSTKQLRAFAIENGNYKPFAWDGFRLILSGQSDLREVLRVWDYKSVRNERETFLRMYRMIQSPDAISAARELSQIGAPEVPFAQLSDAEQVAIVDFLLGRFIADWTGPGEEEE